MNIFFDVDYTILGVDGSLRPGVRELFERLTQEGHRVYVWSGMGIRTLEMQKHGLDGLIAGICEKPLENFQERLKALGITVRPDLVVDDYPEIVSALGGILVRPYYYARTPDNEMERVYNIIQAYVHNGHSDDPAFRPPSAGPRPPTFL